MEVAGKRLESGFCFKLFSSLLVGTILIISISFYITPYWQTNDDVGMSMRVHGYGAFSNPSANLIFSNVLWGHVVSAIPAINGVLGYSIATYLVLTLCASLTCYYLITFGTGYLSSISASLLIYFYPFVFPQFTVNSGLLAVTAMLAFFHYSSAKKIQSLLVFVLLCFFSYLIRSKEFLFVLAVAAPLLYHRTAYKDRVLLLATAFLTILLLSSYLIDKNCYSGMAWDKFNQFNSIRIKLTDYLPVDTTKLVSDFTPHGFTENDINLLRSWFFVDDKLSNPVGLKRLLDDMAPFYQRPGSIGMGFSGLLAPFHKKLAQPVLLMLVVLNFLLPSYRILTAFSIFIAGLFYLGFIGRPGIFRVYYPVICLLIVSLLAFGFRQNKPFRKYFIGSLFLICSIWMIWSTLLLHRPIDTYAKQVKQDAMILSNEMIVTWGSKFPYELLYSPMERNFHSRDLNFYCLGSATYAPHSKAYKYESCKNGFVDRLPSIDGVNFAGVTEDVIPLNGELLRKYCSERHGGYLKLSYIQVLNSISVVNARCITD